MLSLSEVERASRQHNVIPLHREVPADLLTPVGALMALRQKRQPCFLLESVVGGENIARYSFLGTDPFLVIQAVGSDVRECVPWVSRRRLHVPPLEAVASCLSSFRPMPAAGLPRFSGGAVGYFSYDCCRYLERLPDTSENEDPAPDIVLMLFDSLLAFDHAAQRILVIANVMTDAGATVKESYGSACRRLDEMQDLLRRPIEAVPLPEVEPASSRFSPRTPPQTFMDGVLRAKRYIKRGDAFQVVLSQAWRREIRSDPLLFYRMLRRLNPSPYMYYLGLDDHGQSLHLAGTSPEMLVRVEGRRVETRPIAGTRARGDDPARDLALEREMRADPKERAEHVMLVDLGRNDLGRVCQPGTVSVPELMTVERYSHVMHLVSSVRGTLRDGVSPLQALMACFPAGTVTGAPKVRAMEIIEEIEGVRRGVYGGAITYFDFHGNLDSCITIRTLVVKDGRAMAQAGAGIVADSEPEREHAETEHKARVLCLAVDAVDPAPVATEAPPDAASRLRRKGQP